jgi:hypothetical protein
MPEVRWGLIASPDDGRCRGFCAALKSCGAGEPLLLPWTAVAADPVAAAARLAACAIIRLDSPGADPAAWFALGVAPAPCGGWQPGRRRAAALAMVMAALQRALPSARWLNHPQDLLLLLDKRACHERLAAAGLPLPPQLPGVADAADLRTGLGAARWPAAFIKPRWGSSGAGIIAFRCQERSGHRQECALTTMAGTPEAPVLGKRLRRLRDPGLITAWLDRILADGAVVERWIPKLGTSRGPVDLRVVVVSGAARQRIARVGSGPITNLHLGGRRLPMQELYAGRAEQEAAALALAERAAAVFPRSTVIGADLLLDTAWQPWIGELNGWGDLLPGLEDRGEDTFTAAIRAVQRQEDG